MCIDELQNFEVFGFRKLVAQDSRGFFTHKIFTEIQQDEVLKIKLRYEVFAHVRVKVVVGKIHFLQLTQSGVLYKVMNS